MNKSKIAVAVFNKYATQYQKRFMDMATYNGTFNLFCKTINNDKASILELACGPGNITKYLLKKQPYYNILATDLAPNMIDLAKVTNPSAEFKLLDCRRISTLNKKYDAIMCGFGLPYLSKEEAIQLIKDASKALNSKGVIYISTMEDDYSKSELKGSSSYSDSEIFIHFHQEDYLSEALKENGFEIISLQRFDYPETDGSMSIDMVIIAKKKTI